MLKFHSISDQNATIQPNFLRTQLRETSPTSITSQGITEDSSTNSPTMHNPYMFYNSNRKEVYFSNLKEIPHATNTSLHRETVKERMKINIGKLNERNSKYPNQQENRLPNNQPQKHEIEKAVKLFNNIDQQFERSNTRTFSNHTQPGILPTPTIQSAHSTPSQISSHSKTTSGGHILQFNRFKHQTIKEQKPQQTNQAQVNHSKKQMIKVTPQEALRILQKHNSSVISQNQLPTSTNTKSSTRNKC